MESLVTGASCRMHQDVVSKADCTMGVAVTEVYCSMAAVSPSLVIKEIIRIQTDKKMALDRKYYLIAQCQ